MRSVTELRKTCRDRPAAVLGGGPSLPGDLNRVPETSLLISVNHHALYLKPCEFMVFCDPPNRKRMPAFWDAYDIFEGYKISIYEDYGDFKLDAPYWYAGISGTLALWLASYMEASPILLCGFDCFTSVDHYFYRRDPYYPHPCHNYPLENHLSVWRLALGKLKNSDAIKAVSGPLIEVFGEYAGER